MLEFPHIHKKSQVWSYGWYRFGTGNFSPWLSVQKLRAAEGNWNRVNEPMNDLEVLATSVLLSSCVLKVGSNTVNRCEWFHSKLTFANFSQKSPGSFFARYVISLDKAPSHAEVQAALQRNRRSENPLTISMWAEFSSKSSVARLVTSLGLGPRK